MPERNADGLVVIGLLREPRGQVHIENGNHTDIEYTKRQARHLVSGPNSLCYQVWIVRSIFEATPDELIPERKS